MHKLHNPDNITKPASNYAQGVETASDLRHLFVSGQIGMAPDGTIQQGFEAQCRTAFDNIKGVLASAGMGLEDVVKLTVFLTNPADIGAFRGLRDEVMGDVRTASTLLIVAGLASPDFLVEIEVNAAKA